MNTEKQVLKPGIKKLSQTSEALFSNNRDNRCVALQLFAFSSHHPPPLISWVGLQSSKILKATHSPTLHNGLHMLWATEILACKFLFVNCVQFSTIYSNSKAEHEMNPSETIEITIVDTTKYQNKDIKLMFSNSFVNQRNGSEGAGFFIQLFYYLRPWSFVELGKTYFYD